MAPREQVTKEVEVNGVRLQYFEQGSGEPIVFVHGAPHDLRAWEPVREIIANRYRFIAYTQRYFGTKPWPDEGKNYSVATHADDLTKFIISLNAGPVHLVGWSHGGVVAVAAAISEPSMVRSLILYDAGVLSVLPAESPEGKIAREDRAKMFGPIGAAASENGDFTKAAKLLQEIVFGLQPGEFSSVPEYLQTVLVDNARVLPLMFAAPPPPIVTCEMLRDFTRPTLVICGENSRELWSLPSKAIAKCVPGARQVTLKNVGHDGPVRDPAAFTGAVFEFLSSV
ncbi:alpha/beta hydrolase [Bradyrhizobium diazoefficiens]|nr:alpha/beta hydrolase [Bradyrhizobium diazoefficiens]MBR0777506.1 alpha/beta hydrolase [Bradyrhizobium diazoefficiens]